MTGKDVKMFREYHKISRERFSALLKISAKTVQRLEELGDQEIPGRYDLAIKGLKQEGIKV